MSRAAQRKAIAGRGPWAGMGTGRGCVRLANLDYATNEGRVRMNVTFYALNMI